MYWDLIAAFFVTALTAFGLAPAPVQYVNYPVLPGHAQTEVMHPVAPMQAGETIPVEDLSLEGSGVQIPVENTAPAYQPQPYVPPATAMTIQETVQEVKAKGPSAEAISACAGKKQGVFCAFRNDEGNMAYGTCTTPSNSSSIACVSR